MNVDAIYLDCVASDYPTLVEKTRNPIVLDICREVLSLKHEVWQLEQGEDPYLGFRLHTFLSTPNPSPDFSYVGRNVLQKYFVPLLTIADLTRIMNQQYSLLRTILEVYNIPLTCLNPAYYEVALKTFNVEFRTVLIRVDDTYYYYNDEPLFTEEEFVTFANEMAWSMFVPGFDQIMVEQGYNNLFITPQLEGQWGHFEDAVEVQSKELWQPTMEPVILGEIDLAEYD